MTPKELAIPHVKLWKAFCLADTISFQYKGYFPTPPVHSYPFISDINSDHLCSPEDLLLLYSIPAFAFSLGYNSQTLFSQRWSGPYIMGYSAHCFFSCTGYCRNTTTGVLFLRFTLCMPINSVSNPDPGFSMGKWREIKSTEDRLLIQVSISTPSYILSTQG